MSPDAEKPDSQEGTPPPAEPAAAGTPPPPAGETREGKPAVVFHKKSELVGAWSRSLSQMAAKSRLRGARAEAGEKKYSVGDQLQKSAKPPSRLGRVLKAVLLLIVVVGIPLIVGASFVVKVGEKKKRSVAELFWIKFKRLVGLGSASAPAGPPVSHPNVDTYMDILKAQEREKTEIGAVSAILSRRDEKIPWDRETALQLHERLDQIQGRVVKRMEALDQIGQWLQEYGKLAEQTSEAFDRGVGSDARKQACVQHLVRGEPVPSDLAEVAKDPGVLRYVELYRKMELDRYLKVSLTDEEVAASLRDAQAMIRQIRTLRAGLPSRMALGAGGAEEAPKESLPPYDPKTSHPWSRAAAGTWVRYRVLSADGSVSYEDRIVKEVRGDAIVFSGQRASGDQVSDDPEREEQFVPGEFKTLAEEKLQVGGLEIPCLVVQVGQEQRWVARAGRWANRVVLKTRKDGTETVVTGLREEVLPFKDRQYNCIAYQIGEVKFWVHEDVPGFVFRLQAGPVTREVVDFGVALESRPPFPMPPRKAEEPAPAAPREEPKPAVPMEEPKKEEPDKSRPPREEPKPEEPKPEAPREEGKKGEPKPEPPGEEPKKEGPGTESPREESKKEPAREDRLPGVPEPAWAEADRLVIEAGAAFRRLAEAMKNLPEDPAALRALLSLREEVFSLYVRAREAYVAARPMAPPEARVDERIGKIDLLLSLLQKYGDAIKSKLK